MKMVMLGMVSEIGFATLNILGNYLGFLLYIPTPTNQPRIFNVATNPEFFPHIHPTSTPHPPRTSRQFFRDLMIYHQLPVLCWVSVHPMFTHQLLTGAFYVGLLDGLLGVAGMMINSCGSFPKIPY